MPAGLAGWLPEPTRGWSCSVTMLPRSQWLLENAVLTYMKQRRRVICMQGPMGSI